MRNFRLAIVHIFVHSCLILSAQAAQPQVAQLYLSTGKGLINSILYPYYPKRDGDFERLRSYLMNDVESEGSQAKITCTSDGKVPMETPENLVRRMCNQKNSECCLLEVAKAPKETRDPALAIVNHDCFSKNNPLACIAVMGTVKKTTDALAAVAKACDAGMKVACLQKAAFLYGLKKDEQGASEIFDKLCKLKGTGFACYMAYLHAEKVRKDKLAASLYRKDACKIGFKYNCENLPN